MTASSTTNLLGRALEGDRVAFEHLFRPLYDDGFRLAAAMLTDSTQAEDVMQDALLRAWRKLHTFRSGSDVRPWFLTIVANQCRSVRRARWWSVIRVADVHGAVAEEHSLFDSLDLQNALRRLPAAAREILILRYYLDLPFEEVASVLGISISAAKTRTHRALQRLRAAWETAEAVT